MSDGQAIDQYEKSRNVVEKGLNNEELVKKLASRIRKLNKKNGLVIVTLIGGPASGKTTLSKLLVAELGEEAVTLSTDSFVKGDRAWRRTHIENQRRTPLDKYDPEYLSSLIAEISRLNDGEELGVPKYDNRTGVATGADPKKQPDSSRYPTKIRGLKKYLIVEGDFQFIEDPDYNIFLDVDDDVRLGNRLHRDKIKRREHHNDDKHDEIVKENFDLRQKTQFFPYTLPQKKLADSVVKVHAQKGLETDKYIFEYSYDILG